MPQPNGRRIRKKHVKRDHWGFDDPAKATGTEEEKWAFFQRVRDEIEERIKRFADFFLSAREISLYEEEDIMYLNMIKNSPSTLN